MQHKYLGQLNLEMIESESIAKMDKLQIEKK